ncbi:bestrophin family protein [Burkholderia sp. ABCPW 111]|uniref:bestrophin family protein n=1 Tax=Burkholderia sp. ABCPW 111 TaxID=1820025 RepID=UPI000530C877|nr:bestrophin family ion channel [Burkholderia sp. ABCPW 111]KGS03448.1 bestrophin, RFP-TM, chloride channel family protein [Burkholderia sp. ABCPW 111]
MIVRPREHWFRMLFVWNGSVLPSILPQLALMSAVSVVALLTDGRILGEKVPLNPTPFTLAGLALAIFAAFRNNASYDRYWEARKLWGGVLTAARALTSQAIGYDATADGAAFARAAAGFVHALKHQLRGTDPADDLRRRLPADWIAPTLAAQFRPNAILHALRGRLADRHRRGALTDTQLWMLDAQLNELGAKLAGCERIASTPIPFPYHVLLHRTVYAYCVMLPFGLVDSIGIATPFVSVFVSYTLIALDAIAGEIADPFGDGPNHLALDALTRQIERSLLELAGLPLPDEMRAGESHRLT